MMTSFRCNICGTVTGEHGFSWDKEGWPQPKPPKNGILTFDPRLIVLSEEDQNRISELLNVEVRNEPTS